MKTAYVEEIELKVEEMEEVVAPGLKLNHNETLEVELDAEELEEFLFGGRSGSTSRHLSGCRF
jgi:hypothetical protein